MPENDMKIQTQGLEFEMKKISSTLNLRAKGHEFAGEHWLVSIVYNNIY